MSRKCFKLNKCERMDMISELPDEIIGHILSYLPLEDAVATSVLSLRWLNLWKYTPNLVFINTSFNEPMMNIPIAAMPIEEPIDWTYVHSLKNTEWVQSVLNSYKALPIKHSYKALSIKQFTVSLYMHPKTYHHVSKWLYFAFSRQVENLKLDFQFSSFLLDTKTFSGIQISDFKFLKELTLEKFEVSGEAIEFLLRNCSSLEGLVMRAILMSDLVICATLKYLEIHPCGKSGKFIKVFAPNLTRLSCNYDHAMVFLENVPNLVDASFIFVLPEQTMHDFANEAAKLETLNITLMRPRAFSVPQMSKLKKLVLDYAAVYTEYLLPVTCLLEACPYLEEFKFEISDLAMYFMLNSICEAVLEVPKHGEFRHNCLKVFEFGGFYEKAGDHVELVMYIVNKCVALEKIIISPICHAIAREFHGRTGMLDWPLELTQVDAIAEERYALPKKKSTEQLLSAKIPPHIKLIIK